MSFVKQLLTVAFMIGAIQVVSCQPPSGGDVIRHVDVNEFRKLSKIPGAIVLDVRTPQEYSEGHLTGAINLDFSSEGFGAALMTMDKSATYLVYCTSGRRSTMASSQLKEAGFKNVTDLKGGITGWQDAHLPIEKK